MTSLYLRLSIPALILVSASCSGGGGGSGSPVPSQQARADVVVGTATPSQDLLAFSADLESVRLRRADGTFTDNLMSAGPVTIEFLGLGDQHVLVAHREIEPKDYSGMELGFVPGSYRAAASDGTTVTVTSTSDAFVAPIPAVVHIAPDKYARLVVKLDLRDALKGDVSSGAIVFDPEGDSIAEKGLPMLPLRELKALVLGHQPNLVTVRAFADDEQENQLGEMTVQPLTSSPLLLDEADRQVSGDDFYDSLAANQTLTEVHALLCHRGVLRAERVQVEDQNGGLGSVDLVRIEGIVTCQSPNEFELRVREVEDGEQIAEPILASLDPPRILTVTYDGATTFLAANAEADASAVLIGSTVDVRFCSFSGEPFTACQVDVLPRTPSFVGEISDPTGAPDTFQVRMRSFDASVTGGLVLDDATDVSVETTGAFFLMCPNQPLVSSLDLFAGCEVHLEGTFTGTPDQPTLIATKTMVRPGFLDDAELTSADEAASSFQTTGGTLVDAFGPNVTAGAELVHLEPNATFSGRVHDAAGLFDLLTGPDAANVVLDVFGVAGDGTNEIRAAHVEAELEGD